MLLGRLQTVRRPPRQPAAGRRELSLFQKVTSWFENRSGRRLVGVDEQGNKYYASPPATARMTAATSHVKEIREVVYASSSDPEAYVPGGVPVLWQSWLSGQLADPPLTPDEGASRAEQPPAALAQVLNEPAPESAPGADAARAPGQDHASTAPSFRPDSWQPNVKKRD